MEDKDLADSSEDKADSSTVQCDSTQSEETTQSRRGSKSEESPAIIIASRPHSSSSNYMENHLDSAIQMEKNDNVLRVSHYSTNKYSDKISYIFYFSFLQFYR